MTESKSNFAAALNKEENGFTIVQGNEYVQHERTPVRSHSCCGCCCDTRRAVIVVNIISMSFAALAILSLSLLASGGYEINDDEVQAALDELDGQAIGITIGLASCGIVCNTLGIFGALKFNKISIALAGLWYFMECLRACWFFDFVGLIIATFFVYPHVVFYKEIDKGIMTPENYITEQQCCSC